jgi:hypothetical protein
MLNVVGSCHALDPTTSFEPDSSSFPVRRRLPAAREERPLCLVPTFPYQVVIVIVMSPSVETSYTARRTRNVQVPA